MTLPNYVVYKLLKHAAGGVWKVLKKRVRQILKCLEVQLMCNTGQSSEDQTADRNTVSKGQDQESLAERKMPCKSYSSRKSVLTLLYPEDFIGDSDWVWQIN